MARLTTKYDDECTYVLVMQIIEVADVFAAIGVLWVTVLCPVNLVLLNQLSVFESSLFVNFAECVPDPFPVHLEPAVGP